jgi:hypothetical protein
LEPAQKKPRVASDELSPLPSPAETVPADSLCPGLADSSPARSPQPRVESGSKKSTRAKKGKAKHVKKETGISNKQGKQAKRPKGKRTKKSGADPAGQVRSPAEPLEQEEDVTSPEPTEIIGLAHWHNNRAQIYFARADTYRRKAARFEQKGRKHLQQIFTRVQQWRDHRAKHTVEETEPAP